MYCLYYIVHNTTTDHATGNVFTDISYKQWRIQKFWKGGGAEDNLSVPSSFIANTQNEIYAFYKEKAAFWKKNLSQ